VLFGDMQLVPVGQGFVYVRPVYVQASGTSAIPDLRYVVVLANGDLGRSPSLSGALNTLFPGADVVLGDRDGEAPTTTTPGTTPTGDETIEQLLTDAAKLFDEADAALRAGDLAGYQAKINAAKAKVVAAAALATPTTTTVPADSTTTIAPESTTTTTTG
jgi:uncharacterized membrane protein (UPF0182 family)